MHIIVDIEETLSYLAKLAEVSFFSTNEAWVGVAYFLCAPKIGLLDMLIGINRIRFILSISIYVEGTPKNNPHAPHHGGGAIYLQMANAANQLRAWVGTKREELLDIATTLGFWSVGLSSLVEKLLFRDEI